MNFPLFIKIFLVDKYVMYILVSSLSVYNIKVLGCSLAALWVVLREMCRRLESYWGTGGAQAGGEALTVSVSSTLPINDLFSLIDTHFIRRKKHVALNVSHCADVVLLIKLATYSYRV